MSSILSKIPKYAIGPNNNLRVYNPEYIADDIFDPLFNRDVKTQLDLKYGRGLSSVLGGFAELTDTAMNMNADKWSLLGPGMGFLSTFGRSMDKADDFILGSITEGLQGIGHTFNPNIAPAQNPIEQILVEDQDYTGKRLMAAMANNMAKLAGDPETLLTQDDFSGLGYGAAGMGFDLLTDPGIGGGTLARKLAPSAKGLKSADILKNLGNAGVKSAVGEIGQLLSNYDDAMAKLAVNTVIPGMGVTVKKTLAQLMQETGAASSKAFQDATLEGGEFVPYDYGEFAKNQPLYDMADDLYFNYEDYIKRTGDTPDPEVVQQYVAIKKTNPQSSINRPPKAPEKLTAEFRQHTKNAVKKAVEEHDVEQMAELKDLLEGVTTTKTNKFTEWLKANPGADVADLEDAFPADMEEIFQAIKKANPDKSSSELRKLVHNEIGVSENAVQQSLVTAGQGAKFNTFSDFNNEEVSEFVNNIVADTDNAIYNGGILGQINEIQNKIDSEIRARPELVSAAAKEKYFEERQGELMRKWYEGLTDSDLTDDGDMAIFERYTSKMQRYKTLSKGRISHSPQALNRKMMPIVKNYMDSGLSDIYNSVEFDQDTMASLRSFIYEHLKSGHMRDKTLDSFEFIIGATKKDVSAQEYLDHLSDVRDFLNNTLIYKGDFSGVAADGVRYENQFLSQLHSLLNGVADDVVIPFRDSSAAMNKYSFSYKSFSDDILYDPESINPLILNKPRSLKNWGQSSDPLAISMHSQFHDIFVDNFGKIVNEKGEVPLDFLKKIYESRKTYSIKLDDLYVNPQELVKAGDFKRGEIAGLPKIAKDILNGDVTQYAAARKHGLGIDGTRTAPFEKLIKGIIPNDYIKEFELTDEAKDILNDYRQIMADSSLSELAKTNKINSLPEWVGDLHNYALGKVRAKDVQRLFEPTYFDATFSNFDAAPKLEKFKKTVAPLANYAQKADAKQNWKGIEQNISDIHALLNKMRKNETLVDFYNAAENQTKLKELVGNPKFIDMSKLRPEQVNYEINQLRSNLNELITQINTKSVSPELNTKVATQINSLKNKLVELEEHNASIIENATKAERYLRKTMGLNAAEPITDQLLYRHIEKLPMPKFVETISEIPKHVETVKVKEAVAFSLLEPLVEKTGVQSYQELSDYIYSFGTKEERTLFHLLQEATENSRKDSRFLHEDFKQSAASRNPKIKVAADEATALKKYIIDNKAGRAFREYMKARSAANVDMVAGADFLNELASSANGTISTVLKNTDTADINNLRKVLTNNVQSINNAVGSEVIKIIDNPFTDSLGNIHHQIGYRWNAENYKFLTDIDKAMKKKAINFGALQDVIFDHGAPNIKELSKHDVVFDKFFNNLQSISEELSTELGFTKFESEYFKHVFNQLPTSQDFLAKMHEGMPMDLLEEASVKAGDVFNLHGSFRVKELKRSLRGNISRYPDLFSMDPETIVKSTFTSGSFGNSKVQQYMDLVMNGNLSVQNNFRDVKHLKDVLLAKDAAGELTGNAYNLTLYAPKHNEFGRVIGFKRYNKFSDKALEQAFQEGAFLAPTGIFGPLDRILRKQSKMSNKAYQFINKHLTVPFKFGILANPGFLVGNMTDAVYKQAITEAAKYGTSLQDELANVAISFKRVSEIYNTFDEVYDKYNKLLASQSKTGTIPLEQQTLEYITRSSKAREKMFTTVKNNPQLFTPKEINTASMWFMLTDIQGGGAFTKNVLDLQDVAETFNKGKIEIPQTWLEKLFTGSKEYNPKDMKTWGLFANNPLSATIMEKSEKIEEMARATSIYNDLRHKYGEKKLSEFLNFDAIGDHVHKDISAQMLEAMNTMHSANFDYENVTNTLDFAGTFIPFPTFFIKNIGKWLEILVENPTRIDDAISMHEALWTGNTEEHLKSDKFLAESKGRGAIPLTNPNSGQKLSKMFKGLFKPTPLNSMFGAFSQLQNPIEDAKFRLNPALKVATNLAFEDPEEVKYRPFNSNPYQKNLTKNDPQFSSMEYLFHQLYPYTRQTGHLLRTPQKTLDAVRGTGDLQISDFLPSIFQPDFRKKSPKQNKKR